jgi:hypothetical protein
MDELAATPLVPKLTNQPIRASESQGHPSGASRLVTSG